VLKSVGLSKYLVPLSTNVGRKTIIYQNPAGLNAVF
jgi:hypothetical protein